MAKSGSKQSRSGRKRRIPRPRGDKEPLKVNAFRFMQTANTALAPLFPYVDEGSIVLGGSSRRGGPHQVSARFQHFNTVDEVLVVFGAHGVDRIPGLVRVVAKMHMVRSMNFDDPMDKDNVTVHIIAQRQSVGKPQTEEYRFICENCDRQLYVERVDATPPPRGKQRETVGPHVPLGTIVKTYYAAKAFNDNPEVRNCDHCGHQNKPFPIGLWGWDAYAMQTEIAEIAQKSMADVKVG